MLACLYWHNLVIAGLMALSPGLWSLNVSHNRDHSPCPLARLMQLACAGRNVQAPAPGPGQVDVQSLAAILAQAYAQAGQPDLGPSLAQVLRPDALAALVPELDQLNVLELLMHLPVAHQSSGDPRQQLRRTLLSPAFSQQLETISGLLRTGQLTLEQLSLPGQVLVIPCIACCIPKMRPLSGCHSLQLRNRLPSHSESPI